MEWRGQFKAKPNDLTLPHMDEWSDDFDVSLPGPGADQLLKGLIICGTTVGIAGTVLLYGADQHLFRAQHLGPADGGGEKMGIAEGDVGDGDRFANWLGFGRFRDRDSGVGQRRAADLAEDVDFKRQELCEMQCLSHC